MKSKEKKSTQNEKKNERKSSKRLTADSARYTH